MSQYIIIYIIQDNIHTIRLQPDIVMQNFRITYWQNTYFLCYSALHTAKQVNQTQVMGIQCAMLSIIQKRVELVFQKNEWKIITTVQKTQEEKLPLCIKRESFKPHEAATPSFGRRRRGIRQRHWNPPLQFLIRPQTLRHVAVRRARTRLLCVSDFNTNKRPELIYRSAVSHPLHTHAYPLVWRFVINLSAPWKYT